MRSIPGTITEHPHVDQTPLSRQWVKSGDFAVFFLGTTEPEGVTIAEAAIRDALRAEPEQGFKDNTFDGSTVLGVEVHYTQTVGQINALLSRVAEQVGVPHIPWISGLLRSSKQAEVA